MTPGGDGRQAHSGLEGFDVCESRTRTADGHGFDSRQLHGGDPMGKYDGWPKVCSVCRVPEGTPPEAHKMSCPVSKHGRPVVWKVKR